MKKIFIYTILMAGLLMPYGCKKQLDKLPENAKVEGNAITDQPSAIVALNGVYLRFANASSSSTDWSANQLMGSVFAGYLANISNGNADEQDSFNYTGYTSQWGRYYELINAANGVISAVEAMPDNKFVGTKKQEILGEAKFLRAYGHFKLLSFFGQWFDINSPLGVIIEDKFITLTNKDKARSPVKDCYDFIMSDVDFAIANAPATNQNVYATKWTAMALKMRVLLTRAQGDDLTQTAALGNTIITGSPYTLEPNLKDLFYSKGLASNEVMLGIKPQVNQETNYQNMSANFIGHSSIYGATPALVNLYANDPRKAWIIGPLYTKQATVNSYFIKFIQPARTSTVISETAYAFRLTEVYLMAAEATARSGGSLTTAKTLLETVMSKAGVTDFSAVETAAGSSAALQLQIYYEYVRNMTAEDSIEWMALLRLPFATVMQIRPTIVKKDQYILPIPLSEFQFNPGVGPQNPGYTALN